MRKKHGILIKSFQNDIMVSLVAWKRSVNTANLRTYPTAYMNSVYKNAPDNSPLGCLSSTCSSSTVLTLEWSYLCIETSCMSFRKALLIVEIRTNRRRGTRTIDMTTHDLFSHTQTPSAMHCESSSCIRAAMDFYSALRPHDVTSLTGCGLSLRILGLSTFKS